LHVVDLDGAVVGEPVNLEPIRRIRHAVAIPIQLGGGLRQPEHLEAAFGLGIDRVILGSVALSDPGVVETAVATYGDRVAVALDARDGRLAAQGWLVQTEAQATEVALRLRAAGVATFIATDIARDGTLVGPNLASLGELVGLLGRGVIASGGVGSVEDVRAVARVGVDGGVVGRALYDGRVDLGDAIAAAREVVPA
ncbi:MAG: 1-(5-phosphoribosyl)-5-((5-phosphoribosylamino)methylideneamino)imidazole-4-carboxamide isomerase, partial [Chloroflexia bacterium]|nr:1-(5-phosphoribosyl)-5-((5-phosphoribosylamino)methylideneamino)imidazole-4-carboxamide isomerase [Chloroflexia bacterium]